MMPGPFRTPAVPGEIPMDQPTIEDGVKAALDVFAQFEHDQESQIRILMAVAALYNLPIKRIPAEQF